MANNQGDKSNKDRNSGDMGGMNREQNRDSDRMGGQNREHMPETGRKGGEARTNEGMGERGSRQGDQGGGKQGGNRD